MRRQDPYGQLGAWRWTAAAVVAVGLVAGVFAWQHWFASSVRPTVAVLPIEATDAREEIRDLADHLGKRFRLLLASRPEVRVIEYESSGGPSIHGLSVAEKARVLAADYLLTGVLSGKGQNLRLSLQLYSGSEENSCLDCRLPRMRWSRHTRCSRAVPTRGIRSRF